MIQFQDGPRQPTLAALAVVLILCAPGFGYATSATITARSASAAVIEGNAPSPAVPGNAMGSGRTAAGAGPSAARSAIRGGAWPANTGAPRGARSVAAASSAVGCGKALSAFRADVGRYPTAAEGLHALIRQPAGVRNWRGPYVAVTNPARPFADPWGNDYRLVVTPLPGSPNKSVSIRSDGPDGLPDTADDLSVTF